MKLEVSFFSFPDTCMQNKCQKSAGLIVFHFPLLNITPTVQTMHVEQICRGVWMMIYLVSFLTCLHQKAAMIGSSNPGCRWSGKRKLMDGYCLYLTNLFWENAFPLSFYNVCSLKYPLLKLLTVWCVRLLEDHSRKFVFTKVNLNLKIQNGKPVS